MIFRAHERGRINGGAFEYGFVQLAAFCHTEDFRQRPWGRIALQTLNGAGGEDNHAVGRLAAHILLPRVSDHIELVPVELLREAGRGGVANGDPFSIGRNKVGVRHAHTGSRPVPSKDQIPVARILRQVR